MTTGCVAAVAKDAGRGNQRNGGWGRKRKQETRNTGEGMGGLAVSHREHRCQQHQQQTKGALKLASNEPSSVFQFHQNAPMNQCSSPRIACATPHRRNAGDNTNVAPFIVCGAPAAPCAKSMVNGRWLLRRSPTSKRGRGCGRGHCGNTRHGRPEATAATRQRPCGHAAPCRTSNSAS